MLLSLLSISSAGKKSDARCPDCLAYLSSVKFGIVLEYAHRIFLDEGRIPSAKGVIALLGVNCGQTGEKFKVRCADSGEAIAITVSHIDTGGSVTGNFRLEGRDNENPGSSLGAFFFAKSAMIREEISLLLIKRGKSPTAQEILDSKNLMNCGVNKDLYQMSCRPEGNSIKIKATPTNKVGAEYNGVYSLIFQGLN